jgi:hypothetical protein
MGSGICVAESETIIDSAGEEAAEEMCGSRGVGWEAFCGK